MTHRISGKSTKKVLKVEYKVLYTEIVPDKETAKKREKELKEEYKDTEAVSIHYFSL